MLWHVFREDVAFSQLFWMQFRWLSLWAALGQFVLVVGRRCPSLHLRQSLPLLTLPAFQAYQGEMGFHPLWANPAGVDDCFHQSVRELESWDHTS